MPCYLVPPGVRFNDCLFSEPAPLSSWRPPGCGGIAVILARNSQWGPKPLQPLYFAEFGNNMSLPEEARAESLLVSVLPMPFSTAAQRRALCKDLIAAYNPPYQASAMARKIDDLEARQQEQGQQILSLLTYMGKLFEPQPIGPRRPIGFLAQLASTESGS